ncbi:MAG: hypothetical protein WA890_30460 [Micromonospora sp.]
MRGKHQRARQHRQATTLATQLERLRADIASEGERGAVARMDAAQSRAAQQRLIREQAVTNSRLQPHENAAARLLTAATRASTVIADARHELDAIERELSRFNDASVRQIRQSGVKLRFTEVHRCADERYVQTWYRKKTGAQFDDVRNVHLDGWVPEATPVSRDALAPFATSTVLDVSPQACWAWAVPPWLRLPDDTADAPALRRQLGTTIPGAPTMRSTPYPGPHQRSDAVLTTPWRHTPLVNQVGDAVDLSYWYHRSAWVQQWHVDHTPVPFWLPAEHAVAYPQTRPLPAGTDIRLPYPVVLATFAAPWRIEPRAGDLPAALATVSLLMLHARGCAAYISSPSLATVLARLQATGLTDRTQLPTPLEALDQFGGVVEGLLLTADSDGRPRDEFAWCIAVGHPSGFPIARITVPASRAASGWRTQIANITAGIALSCWHEPIGAPIPSAATRQRPPFDQNTTGATAALRVLDIDATSPPPPSRAKPSAEPSHDARPHLRRGHWRQQRVGPGRRHRRWTWVRPTTVNGNSTLVDQVYVLRNR